MKEFYFFQSGNLRKILKIREFEKDAYKSGNLIDPKENVASLLYIHSQILYSQGLAGKMRT